MSRRDVNLWWELAGLPIKPQTRGVCFQSMIHFDMRPASGGNRRVGAPIEHQGGGECYGPTNAPECWRHIISDRRHNVGLASLRNAPLYVHALWATNRGGGVVVGGSSRRRRSTKRGGVCIHWRRRPIWLPKRAPLVMAITQMNELTSTKQTQSVMPSTVARN